MQYIWIESSSKKKRVALSKEGFYLSAKTVCERFNVTSDDTWGVCIPKTHVGGLSIYARSEVSGCNIKELGSKWNPGAAYEFLGSVSVVSLVPTQVFDLVQLGLKAPQSLRLVIVGGGPLLNRKEAENLSYPIAETYGMTELSSMAGVKVEESYQILPHLMVKEVDGVLYFKGESVAKVIETNGSRINVPEWYESDDLGVVLKEGVFTVNGRRGREVKILGELVNLEDVEASISEFIKARFVVVARTDERRGNRLALVSEDKVDIEYINSKLQGIYRLSENIVMERLPLTESGKIDLE